MRNDIRVVDARTRNPATLARRIICADSPVGSVVFASNRFGKRADGGIFHNVPSLNYFAIPVTEVDRPGFFFDRLGYGKQVRREILTRERDGAATLNGRANFGQSAIRANVERVKRLAFACRSTRKSHGDGFLGRNRGIFGIGEGDINGVYGNDRNLFPEKRSYSTRVVVAHCSENELGAFD